jgi:2-desacetyl-2-hydroxyethyl bacteriochlorophyllide A dehydrogenase
MKAAVVHGANDIRLEEAPLPVPEDGDIVVRVRASGICATDVKTLLGQGLPKNLPTILGHEVAGEVSALGKGVQGIAAGDRVTVYPIAVCGECDYCLHGRHNLCRREFGLAHGIDGGFAEYVRIPRQIIDAEGVIKIPAELPFELAALAEPLSCGLAALRVNRVQPGDTVVVVGAGPMGMIHLLLSKWRGARVIIIEKTPGRREFAAGLGADTVIDPQALDPREEVMKLTAGEGAEAVITSLSDPRVIEASLPLVKKGGVFNIFGGPPAGSLISIDARRVHYQELTITGSFASTPQDFREAVRLISSQEIDAGRLITDRFTLDSILDAIERARSLKMIKGIVVVGG